MKALVIFGILINALAVIMQISNGNLGWVLINGVCFIYLGIEYKNKYYGKEKKRRIRR